MAFQWHSLIGLAVFLVALSYHYREDIKVFVARPVGDGVQRQGGDGEGAEPVTADAPYQKTQTKTDTREQTEMKRPLTTSEGGSDSPVPEETPSTEGGTALPVPEKSPSVEYYNPPFDPANPTELYSEAGTRLVTLNELASHGHSGPLKAIWLSILGNVFDVSVGRERYYGPKGGYNFFTGRDGTRAYVTGQFDEEGLVDDIEGLTPLQVGEVDEWIKFYNKEYKYVGKLIGRYYDRDGSPTRAWYKYKKLLGEQERAKAAQKELEKRFPGCNSRWNEKDGGTVFCSEKSGGIHRDWVGVPRRLFSPGMGRSWRCACVNEKDLDHPHLRLYPDCDPSAITCKVNKEKLREMEG